MKIEQMLIRENFDYINERTLERYFKIVHNKDVQIKTNPYNMGDSIVIYTRIGSIVTRFPSLKIVKFLSNEYNIRDNYIKFLLAKVYVLSCFSLFGLLSQKGFYISDKTAFNRFIAIIPSNRKIRIYNFKAGYVDAIIKSTFTHKYFNNEVTFRLNNRYDFVLPIIDYGDDWYRERLLPGQPLARVRNKKLYKKGINDAINQIGIIAKKTLQYVNPAKYANNLYTMIQKKMDIALANKHIDCYNVILKIAEEALKTAALLDAPIPLVESHGDLQSGNVWIDIEKEKTYIIDWETHEKRSIWYDCATLLLSIRRADKLKKMMNDHETDSVKKAILMNDNRKDYNMKAVMGIITLEDIMFYLDDMLELPQDFGRDIFNRIAIEIDMMGWRPQTNAR